MGRKIYGGRACREIFKELLFIIEELRTATVAILLIFLMMMHTVSSNKCDLLIYGLFLHSAQENLLLIGSREKRLIPQLPT